ncbi:hypothetical protein [Streptomyces cinereoruber]|uniref:hypothetical protein n=1 Tax=Streptomyces cinereoruber TaxID=67260 RepID=UPI00142568FD|nr:hypothetical protein [Streptomyces cinereoruber]MBB4160069.1 hypothetical protein [Streptomyces cinereoruber]MBY8818320.1 hypothetical protein [Streptomyces cinereoruber]NIH61007.1 hypothetical protein [Streptomyces cinereoruber]
MSEEAQWVCEAIGLACGATGAVLLAACLWGAVGAAVTLLVLAVVLVALGNIPRKGDS